MIHAILLIAAGAVVGRQGEASPYKLRRFRMILLEWMLCGWGGWLLYLEISAADSVPDSLAIVAGIATAAAFTLCHEDPRKAA